MLSFGIVYWEIVTISKNDNFVFVQDIKLNTVARTYPLNGRQFYSNKIIGETWGNYYRNYFTNKGATHYSTDFLGIENNPFNEPKILSKSIDDLVFNKESKSEEDKLYKYEVKIYKTQNLNNKYEVGYKEMDAI